MKFASGYNLLLNIEDVPEGFRKLGIIQLLSDMRGDRNIPRDVAVVAVHAIKNAREVLSWIEKNI